VSLAFPKPLPQEPKKKGLRPTDRAESKDRALEAWKREVKARAGNVCEMAGLHHRCASLLDAHHILSRGAHPRLALDLENGVALCRNAHDLVHRSRWFKPYFKAWVDEKFPGRRERLLAKAASR
jgi:hypothetical protein